MKDLILQIHNIGEYYYYGHYSGDLIPDNIIFYYNNGKELLRELQFLEI